MRWSITRLSTMVLTVICLLLCGACGGAGDDVPLVAGSMSGKATQRDLDDFLDAQGTYTAAQGGPWYFPPVPDHSGWADGNFVNFALIDYAGLADAYIEDASDGSVSLGTTMSGKITERTLSSGRAEVRVLLRTKKALAFAQLVEDILVFDDEGNVIGADFAGTDTVFGNKAVDVADGATPALGWAHLEVTFTMDEPDADLPDFLEIFDFPADYQPAKFSFKSVTFGTRPDGTKARLKVHQTGAIESVYDEDAGDWNWTWVYPKEKVELKDM